MLSIDQFDYHLPDKLIAQRPVTPRDSSRLMVVDCQKQQIQHGSQFKDLVSVLDKNSLLVRNNTKVIPARILGKKPTGGQVELLLLERLSIQNKQEVWECLSKPGVKPGQTIKFDSSLTGRCKEIKGYTRLIEFNQTKDQLLTTLEQIGHTPTPPYIEWNKEDEPKLRKKYQTVYAKIKGSAAAPTAGLHFTPQLNQSLAAKGIEVCDVTLHVGLGTFQPVKTKEIKHHDMHAEWFDLNQETADKLNQAKIKGKQIVAVGTTSTRVLEASSNEKGRVSAQQGKTEIFIYPGYKFKLVDSLITNFHLPKSTLLMLVSAFCSQPNTDQQFKNFKQSLIGQAYQQAIKKDYRFYSFGDAMLLTNSSK